MYLKNQRSTRRQKTTRTEISWKDSWPRAAHLLYNVSEEIVKWFFSLLTDQLLCSAFPITFSFWPSNLCCLWRYIQIIWLLLRDCTPGKTLKSQRIIIKAAHFLQRSAKLLHPVKYIWRTIQRIARFINTWRIYGKVVSLNSIDNSCKMISQVRRSRWKPLAKQKPSTIQSWGNAPETARWGSRQGWGLEECLVSFYLLKKVRSMIVWHWHRPEKKDFDCWNGRNCRWHLWWFQCLQCWPSRPRPNTS